MRVLRQRRRAVEAQIEIFRVYDIETEAGITQETVAHGRAHAAFYSAWRQTPLWARIGVWRAAVREHYGLS